MVVPELPQTWLEEIGAQIDSTTILRVLCGEGNDLIDLQVPYFNGGILGVENEGIFNHHGMDFDLYRIDGDAHIAVEEGISLSTF